MITPRIMANTIQSIEFMLESVSFIMGGFLVGLRIRWGYPLIVFAFFMAYITGKQIERDVIKKYKVTK